MSPLVHGCERQRGAGLMAEPYVCQTHSWQRVAYHGSGVAPILCAHCAKPMPYQPERLSVWNADPLTAARLMEEAYARMMNRFTEVR